MIFLVGDIYRGNITMKSKFATTALSLTLSIPACLIMSDVYANASDRYLYSVHGINAQVWDRVYFFGDLDPTFHGFNSDFGNAGYLENPWFQPVRGKDNIRYGVLPGKSKRSGIFKLQTKVDGSRVDFVADSKESAQAVCTKLLDAAKTNPYSHDARSIHVGTSMGDEAGMQIIAVAYKIAYGEGSTLAADGKTSTPAKKHVFCDHPWDKNEWKLESKYADEDERTGIRTVDYKPSEYYDVTCMNGKTALFKPTSIESGRMRWKDERSRAVFSITNLDPNEHELNEHISADGGNNFCPL